MAFGAGAVLRRLVRRPSLMRYAVVEQEYETLEHAEAAAAALSLFLKPRRALQAEVRDALQRRQERILSILPRLARAAQPVSADESPAAGEAYSEIIWQPPEEERFTDIARQIRNFRQPGVQPAAVPEGPSSARLAAEPFLAPGETIDEPTRQLLRDLRRVISDRAEAVAAGFIGSGDGATARRAALVAGLVAAEDIGFTPQNALLAAARLARALPVDAGAFAVWRASADRLNQEGRTDAEASLLMFMLAAGDIDGVRARLERQPDAALVALLSFMPLSYVWQDGGPVEGEWDELPEGALAIADGAGALRLTGLSSGACYVIPRGAAPQVSPGADLVSRFTPSYSAAEERLCAFTEELAARLAGLYAGPFTGTRLDAIARSLKAAEIRFDDVLFAALLPAWAALEAAGQTDASAIVIASEVATFSTGIARAIHARNPAKTVIQRVPFGHDLNQIDDSADTVAAPDPGLLVEDTAAWLESAGIKSFGVALASYEASGSTLFLGRPSDRNYATDLRALVIEAARDGEVHLVPSALRMKPGLAAENVIGELLGRQERLRVWYGPESNERSVKRGNVPASLIQHAEHVWQMFLDELDETGRALALLAAPQIKRLLEHVAPAMILAAGQIRDIVEEARPSRVVALPGRDWISQMALAEIAARRDTAIGGRPVSIDVQTVFIGPRRRYKATTCDLQIAIETHSQALFTDFFGVDAQRVILAGAVRYAASLSAARAAQRARGASAPAEPVILFTASPLLDQCLPVLEALVAAVAGIAGVRLAVRPHPSSEPHERGMLSEALAPLGNRAQLDAASTLADALAAARCVVTRFSNTGLEAAMIGKPVLACNFTAEPPPIPLDRMGVALAITSPADLGPALADALEGGPMSARLAMAREAYFEANPQLLNEAAAAAIWSKIRTARAPA